MSSEQTGGEGQQVGIMNGKLSEGNGYGLDELALTQGGDNLEKNKDGQGSGDGKVEKPTVKVDQDGSAPEGVKSKVEKLTVSPDQGGDTPEVLKSKIEKPAVKVDQDGNVSEVAKSKVEKPAVKVDQDGNVSEVVKSKAPNSSDDDEFSLEIMHGHLDRYGFATTDTGSDRLNMNAMSLARDRQTYWSRIETPSQRRQRVRLEDLRIQKWMNMLSKWDYEIGKKRKRFDRRVRKGIPDCFRDKVWPKLLKLHPLRDTLKGETYENLLLKANKSTETEVAHTRECISRDIGRTFPRHVVFHRRNGIGQRALTNVLRAYSMLDREVGYCQGMGFIVGLLLGYLTEENVFCLFQTCMLCEPWNMSELYKPGMPGSQLLLHQFETLLKIHIPDVAAHLDRELIVPSMYATQWFITVFTYNFPFDVVVRVWDVFLLEGWPIVFQVAIAIMKQNRKEILKRKFEHILEFFRGIPPSLNPQEIMELAVKIPITQAQLAAIRFP
eukprot:CAMPEP_0203758240 /NCGR_PEP_ID=MMETSP0098-20131031/10996_1 /ASSEMBLY_ACC=CAM_ASM_000208 /TAXON_ID=96639 /ORGANISM=" , Strain NY0313808BC1" /LENGTH=495 /DNA_ID=CAMNT_0050650551 /DNA_START=133 /DNA_END=1617 /DNA_ORIENTATION=-